MPPGVLFGVVTGYVWRLGFGNTQAAADMPDSFGRVIGGFR
jgi:hypothetical protein